MSLRRRAYVKFGRIVGPAAIVGLKVYTRITNLPRVRVLVTNEHGEVLLVRGIISHRSRWTLPGGGVNKGEDIVAAAARELHEESGMNKSQSAFEYLRTIQKGELELDFVAPIYHVSVRRDELPKDMFNPSEIADIRWFKADALPDHRAAIVTAIVNEYSHLTKDKKHV